MNFSEKVLRLVDLENPPELTLRKRDAVLSLADLRAAAEGWPDGNRNETLSSLILLWHDHWPESHAIAQAHEGVRDFDLLHAIGHRREGDFSNSSYWFDEAGEHPMYGNLSAKILETFGTDVELNRKLLPAGKWKPRTFVQLVKQNPGDRVLRSIQALEFRCFLDYLISGSQ